MMVVAVEINGWNGALLVLAAYVGVWTGRVGDLPVA